MPGVHLPFLSSCLTVNRSPSPEEPSIVDSINVTRVTEARTLSSARFTTLMQILRQRQSQQDYINRVVAIKQPFVK